MPHEQFWFLNTLTTIRIAHNSGADGISVIEHLLPFGDSPPLHIHHTEDEVFHILEGRVAFEVAGKRIACEPGQILLAPKGIPHTYIVKSREARYLTITRIGDFERLVRQLGRKAERPELPPPLEVTPVIMEQFKKIFVVHHIEAVGPPLSA